MVRTAITAKFKFLVNAKRIFFFLEIIDNFYTIFCFVFEVGNYNISSIFYDWTTVRVRKKYARSLKKNVHFRINNQYILIII